MKKDILKIAEKLSIGLISCIPSTKLNDLRQNFVMEEKRDNLSSFDTKDISKKINPNEHLRGCKSILVIGFPYFLSSAKDKKSMGKFSAIAISKDYHMILEEKLNTIATFLKNEYPNLNYKICVDKCFLSDKGIAKKAGFGYLGKNKLLISKKYGSAFNIGYILLDKEISFFKVDNQLQSCEKCDLCLINCPTGALSHEGYNVKKCISELNQIKRILNFKEREWIGNRIYGCDICQQVCPKNKLIKRESIEKSYIDLFELISLSNKKFKEKFRDYCFTWRGNSVIKRNAIIAMGNSKDKKFIECLKEIVSKHQSYDLKKYALWAIFKIDFMSFNSLKLQNNILKKEKEKIIQYYD